MCGVWTRAWRVPSPETPLGIAASGNDGGGGAPPELGWFSSNGLSGLLEASRRRRRRPLAPAVPPASRTISHAR